MAADGTATVTTESGQTFTMNRETQAFLEVPSGYQIHWNDEGGTIKVSSVVQRPVTPQNNTL